MSDLIEVTILLDRESLKMFSDPNVYLYTHEELCL